MWRRGISAKQLDRELMVTHKTAWRMMNRIRSLVSDDGSVLTGSVETDEAFIGRQAKWHKPRQPRRPGRDTSETPVFRMAERGTGDQHGRAVAKVVKGTSRSDLLRHLRTHVMLASIIYMDAPASCVLARWGTDATGATVPSTSTGTNEGYWSLLNRKISEVYHPVSAKHLQAYLDEHAFRCNHRDANGKGTFTAILDRMEKAS